MFKDFKMKKNRPNVGSMPLKGGGDEKPETEIDLNPILSLPVSVIQAGIVDQNNYISVLEVITRVETTVLKFLFEFVGTRSSVRSTDPAFMF